MRKLLLLRPEPGLTASAEGARELGLEVICCPLFQVEPMGWQAPERPRHDALLLTSTNAVRHGGPQLGRLRKLPVHAVGAATAAAARDAGFEVATVGSGDITDLLGMLPPALHLLHLAGKDHRDTGDSRIERIVVYRSAAIAGVGLPALASLVVAVHSPRAGQRLAELAPERCSTTIAAISAAAAQACGPGWERVEAAQEPNDNSLLALAARLCHTSSPQ